MKEYWKFATPEYLYSGENSSRDFPEYLRDMKINKPFLVIDPMVLETEKGQEIAKEILAHEGLIFSDFTTNPTTYQVMAAVQQFSEHQPDGVVAVGGGSAIDLAKAMMLVGINGGTVWEYLAGKKGEGAFPPFIALPTTCGTGSEASPYAVITDPDAKKKRGMESHEFLPKLVVMDPLLLLSLDQTILAATAIDALAHIIESYISKKANKLTRGSARGLLVDVKPAIEKASLEHDVQGIESMMNAAFSSRLLYPRTGLTIAHALSHPLGAFTGIHHGLAVASFLPESLAYNASFSGKTLEEISHLMGFKDFDEYQDWFAKFSKESGIAQGIISALAGKILPVEQMAEDAMQSSNIPSNPRSVNSKDLEGVITDSMKYWGVQL